MDTYFKASKEEAANLRVDNIIAQGIALLISSSHQAGQQVTRMLVSAWNNQNSLSIKSVYINHPSQGNSADY